MTKIIVVTGPTGVGKTTLGIALARYFNGEIINADSKQVYKELNIGTNKVRKEEQVGIKHHLLDIQSIDTEPYNAYKYQQAGRFLLDKIRERGKIPIIVGGTGLYIKALLYDYRFQGDNSNKNVLLYDVIFIGLTAERELLYKRLNKRVDQMLEQGLKEEVRALYKKEKGKELLLATIGYKELYHYFSGLFSLEEAVTLIKRNTRRYVKRQITWFKHQMNLKWFVVDFNDFNKTIKAVTSYIEQVINNDK